MTFFQRILTTTDFSDASRAGVRKAAEIAVEASASVLLVHVWDPVPFAPLTTRGLDVSGQVDAEREVRRSIERALEAVRKNELGDVADVRTEMVLGTSAADAILPPRRAGRDRPHRDEHERPDRARAARDRKRDRSRHPSREVQRAQRAERPNVTESAPSARPTERRSS